MFDVTQIKTGFSGLIGWRQNPDATGFQLSELNSSSSGLWFNDVHPLLTFNNLLSIADPSFDETQFEAYLKQKTEAGIIKALTAWIDKKMQNRTAKNLLTNDYLFNHIVNLNDLQTSTNDLCGIEIIPNKSNSIVFNVEQISIALSQNQTIEVKLFEAGKISPIETATVIYTGSGAAQWTTVNWELKGNRAYYIAYNQEDLTGQAINGVYEYGFDRNGSVQFPTEKFYKAAAFRADSDGSQIWDISKNVYTASTNYGLNLKLNVKCDYTDFFVDQKGLFANLVSYQVAMDILREFAFNPEANINRHENNIDLNNILYEIDGDSQGRNANTISGRFFAALDSIQFDETGIDKVCLPCKRRSIRYKSIGPRWI